MDATCFYFEFNYSEMTKHNGEPVKSLRKIKLAGDELNFHLVEPGVMQYFGEDKDEFTSTGLFIIRMEQFDVIKFFKRFIVRYPDGKMEDVLGTYNKHEEKARKLGWRDENGNPLPVPRSKKKTP